jgi:deoxyribonuclease V
LASPRFDVLTFRRLFVKIPHGLHSWSVTSRQASAIQRRLAVRVIREGDLSSARLAAGADLAFSENGSQCIAGVIVWDVRDGAIVEQHVVRRAVRFPYVPGLLSFREAPAILAALRRLRCEPDVFLFDGQGVAHPRRFGLASHLGVLIDRPSVGCAKRRLVGAGDDPEAAKGSTSLLCDGGECIGAIVRTRDHVKPIYVSIGHRISLATAVEVVLASCTRFRLPEPTRLADKLVARERSGR